MFVGKSKIYVNRTVSVDTNSENLISNIKIKMSINTPVTINLRMVLQLSFPPKMQVRIAWINNLSLHEER